MAYFTILMKIAQAKIRVYSWDSSSSDGPPGRIWLLLSYHSSHSFPSSRYYYHRTSQTGIWSKCSTTKDFQETEIWKARLENLWVTTSETLDYIYYLSHSEVIHYFVRSWVMKKKKNVQLNSSEHKWQLSSIEDYHPFPRHGLIFNCVAWHITC